MKKNYGLQNGDFVKLKDNNYLCGQIDSILPIGSYGKTYGLAKVLTSPNWDFSFSLVKVFALRDLVKVDRKA